MGGGAGAGGRLAEVRINFAWQGNSLPSWCAGQVRRCTSVLDGKQYAVKEGPVHTPGDFNGRHGLLNELWTLQQLCLSPCVPAGSCSASTCTTFFQFMFDVRARNCSCGRC